MNSRYKASGPAGWLVSIAITTVLLVASSKALWIVVPLLLAIILYYMLYPIVHDLEMAGISRETAAALVMAGIAVLAIAAMVAMLPWLIAQSVSGEEAVNKYLEGGRILIDRTLATLEAHFSFLKRLDFHAEMGRKAEEFGDVFMRKHLAENLLKAATGLPSLLLAPFFAFFLLRDGGRLLRLLCEAVPNAFFERSIHMFERVHTTARNYFQGLLKLAFVDTAVLAAGLWILGVPSAFGLALAAAVLAWIPLVGAGLGGIIIVLAAATAFPDDPSIVYGCIVLFLFVRMLDSFVVMPLTVGRSIRMHPALTVVMIFIGGAVAGVPGLMLALPLTGVVSTVVETVSGIVNDPRLRARHAFAKSLEAQRMNADLRL